MTIKPAGTVNIFGLFQILPRMFLYKKLIRLSGLILMTTAIKNPAQGSNNGYSKETKLL